jgi:hypothetical protein
LLCNIAFCQTYYHLNSIQNNPNIDWSNTNLITTDNDWGNIPYLTGFRGDGLTLSTDTDPRTITADGTGTPVVIYANQTDPNTFNADGFAEFESLANPTIAFRASNTASAPFLMMYFNTLNPDLDFFPTLTFLLRDIDGTANNAVQQVSMQYRIGEAGPFIPAEEFFYVLPAFDYFRGYHPDATRGPFLEGHESFCAFMFPISCRNQPKVQVRIMISNATGGNEWLGIDDIRFGGVQLLPIKLESFSAVEKNNKVVLNWKASSENLMEHFEIERSADGVLFHKIETVNAKGIGEYNYSLTDVSPLNGRGFYRLKLINSDGRFTYSDVLSVNLSLKDAYLNSLYPRVTSTKINLLITTNKNVDATLQIINLQGAIVKKIYLNLNSGSNSIPIDVHSLPSGNYFIRINVNGDFITERFIKQ